jgi:branched-chain amino acid transport system substrate-binding protein
MNTNRLLTRLSILLMVFILVSCAKLPFITSRPAQPTAAAAAKAEKVVAPPSVKQPETKAPEIKTTAIKPQEVKPPQTPVHAPQIAVTPIKRNTIGCILPLTGRYEAQGSKALDAILLSAGIFDLKIKTPWEVVAADSSELSEGITAAIDHLANKKNVIAIIAMVGAAEATEAAREAQKWKVPLILITSKEGITEGHDYVFQHFLTPSQQIRALVKYSLDSLNVAIFSILYPEDDYGREMSILFRDEAKKIGGKVDKAIPYSKAQTDFTEHINKLTGNKLSKSEKVYGGKEDTGTRMSVNFEALFIPDSHLRVKMITSQLAFYDVKGINLLGTSLWNSSELLKKRPEYLEGAVFADSFFIESYYPETNDFIEIYYSAYRREPTSLEALVYDTAQIVFGVLENNQIITRSDFVASLQKVDRFRGATGQVYFDENRVAQKTPFILKVVNGKMRQVK